MTHDDLPRQARDSQTPGKLNDANETVVCSDRSCGAVADAGGILVSGVVVIVHVMEIEQRVLVSAAVRRVIGRRHPAVPA